MVARSGLGPCRPSHYGDLARRHARGRARGRFAYGLTTGLAARARSGLATGLATGLPTGLMTGLATGLTFGLLVGLVYPQSWSSSLAFAQLAASDRTPVRLMRFLENARSRSVLRTVGPVYQFRHGRLQDRLAAQEPATGQAGPGEPRLAAGDAAASAVGAPARAFRPAAAASLV